MASYDFKITEDWLVCNTCGTQFPTADRNEVKTCKICDDPRQYTPPSGQSFTTLKDIRSKHKNEFHSYAADDRMTFIVSSPKVGIGQRACLIKTPAGYIMWDCISLLDKDTISHINSLGGLKAIVISHPHYYSTHLEWAKAFNCPVYIAAEDKVWTTQTSPAQVLLDTIEREIEVDGVKTGAKAIKLGGHFPGSLVLLFGGHLLIADTLLTTPSGMGSWETDALGNPRSRPEGMNSFSFMWSIPNFIPLSADEIARMWSILKDYEFKSTHGAFLTQDIEAADIKKRVLDSMQIQTKFMGWTEHPFMKESL
ncbi:putative metallo-beta-lactamase family protein [Phaeoacremonium minimum UCRPA7]|uniref:Putative metallo-beta-lactamase family protein n=1 Tax=Phaeoacremonium minimum (strain UCR-PA7) TaxID=1286976 RepID=R8BV65_PHAM7|nr:putative metallo-beta-lactamase family protein [Phaeoacremonium minimum UCRPA7]EOO03243.1 putative metallo-beta-lactamase family protein [Phaeoacremonium minimum UCRPA7]